MIKGACDWFRTNCLDQEFHNFMRGTGNLNDISNADDWEDFTTSFCSCIDELEAILHERLHDRSDTYSQEANPCVDNWVCSPNRIPALVR